MTYCGERTAVKYGHEERLGVTLFCKSWACPDCAEKRKRRLIAEVCGGSPTAFLTLTIRREEGKTAALAASELSKAWQTLRKRLMYYRGWRKLPFFAVFEPTKLGYPHLHIFVRMAFVSQLELSCWMSHLIGSPIVHIRAIDNKGRAAGYASKYTTKHNTKFGTCKRYWQSADYDLRPKDTRKRDYLPGEGWELDNRPLHQFAKDWHSLGWLIEWRTASVCAARAPPS